eukprot:CAMPEP_0169146178 /NCGR_PEP_ID=MMETSP1015-20121227/47383_1 /TAXON_ID=342587 /ORGANISM="Karlodinium micrum, Strain CCMP2283" /LENGTH=95 /DNA_ID=CAMNT_0009213971 /DNA_START=231 /DNA_END=514 /DNA_ORIENTATION=+
MTAMTGMHNTTALFVKVQQARLPMRAGTLVAAELEPCSFKILAEADVERNIAVIGMHIQAKVMTHLIPHDEGVLMPKERTNTWKHCISNRLQHLA